MADYRLSLNDHSETVVNFSYIEILPRYLSSYSQNCHMTIYGETTKQLIVGHYDNDYKTKGLVNIDQILYSLYPKMSLYNVW